MAKKTTKKPAAPKTAPKAKTESNPSKFQVALHSELRKVEKSMTDAELKVWLEKSPVGKAVLKAYTSIHG